MTGWRVRFTRRARRWPVEPRELLVELGPIADWLDGESIPDGIPFLIAPDGSYDVVLNQYFLSLRMAAASRHTHDAVARDLARFLEFLWFHRPGVEGGGGVMRPRTWRDAEVEDRRVFELWRCRDEDGPLVAASTWEREVSSVNSFYRWAVRFGHVALSPMVQRRSRTRPGRRGAGEQETAAERRPDVRRDRVEWLTPRAYREWRDVGLLGYGRDGMPSGVPRGS